MTAGGWLERRIVDTPLPLRSRLERQIAELDANVELSDALLARACAVLDRARGKLDDRDAAFDLLVADGLLTLACEAVAYADPARVAERCREMGPGGVMGRLAQRWRGRG